MPLDANALDAMIGSAVAATDSAANEFENCGERADGDVPNGLVIFHRCLGRAQVELVRAQIDILRAQVEIAKAGT